MLLSTIGQFDSARDIFQSLGAVLGFFTTFGAIVLGGWVTVKVVNKKVADQTINEQTTLIDQFRLRVDELEERVKSLSDEVKNHKGHIDEQLVEIVSLRDRCHIQAKELEKMEKTVVEQTAEIHALRERAVKAETELDVLKRYSVSPEALENIQSIVKESIESILKENK